MRKLCIAIGVIFAVLFVINSQTTAQGDIYGCVSNRDGKLRIVSDPNECNSKKETPIFWNQVGPQGETGPAGPQGDKGDSGPMGPEGPPGAGCLGVYNGDEDETFLGYFAGTSVDSYTSPTRHRLEVFDPGQERFYQIRVSQPTPEAREVAVVLNLFYDQTNCEGEPYIQYRDGVGGSANRGSHFFGVMKLEPDDTYYIINTEIRSVKRLYDMKSWYHSGICDETGSGNDSPCYPAEQIDPPWWATTPLEHPIEIRPIE